MTDCRSTALPVGSRPIGGPFFANLLVAVGHAVGADASLTQIPSLG